ncbi:hypothetical protein [Halomonas sp. HG01]|uniref:hypothetical protein n=1 Tax=Halomonas sp. HG01 TaxID=1609967 RepID=UPI0006144B92|nr:hypothetical protein [Halomonas sp. HG01]
MSREDHYDNLTLAREHLENAATMFKTIVVLLESDAPDALKHAKRIASLSHDSADIAAGDFDDFASELKAEEGKA